MQLTGVACWVLPVSMDNILIEAHTKTPSIHMDNLFVSAPKQYRRVRPTPILYANEKQDATSQNVKLAVVHYKETSSLTASGVAV